MNLSTAISLPAKEFWENPEIVLAIQSVLGPKSIRHAAIATDSGPHAPMKCKRCGTEWDNPQLRMRDRTDCPVPPPLDLAPETVARRLIEASIQEVGHEQLWIYVWRVWNEEGCPAPLHMSGAYEAARVAWHFALAGAHIRAICPLLALGKLEGD